MNKNINNQFEIFLDMDGVLVDFDGGFMKQSGGIHTKDYYNKYGNELATAKYIQAGLKFWTELDWIEGGKELLECASLLFKRVCILSSSGFLTPESREMVQEGKRIWLKKHIPSISSNDVFIVAGRKLKQKYSGPNKILVDDLAPTIQEWDSKGGIGILHSAKNYKKTIDALHTLASPMKLTEILKSIKPKSI